jgi:hypothetical protein
VSSLLERYDRRLVDDVTLSLLGDSEVEVEVDEKRGEE